MIPVCREEVDTFHPRSFFLFEEPPESLQLLFSPFRARCLSLLSRSALSVCQCVRVCLSFLEARVHRASPVYRGDAIKMYMFASLCCVMCCVMLCGVCCVAYFTRPALSQVQFNFAPVCGSRRDDKSGCRLPLPLFPSGCFKQTHTSLPLFFFLLSIT